MTFLLDSALVAKTWIASIPTGAAGVAMSLPEDYSLWGSDGFIVIESVLGNTGTPGSRLRVPAISVGVYACNPETVGTGIKPRAPWKIASNISEIIVRYTDLYFNPEYEPAPLAVSGYEPVLIKNAYMLSDPRRIPGDEGNMAVYRFDIALAWTSNELLNA